MRRVPHLLYLPSYVKRTTKCQNVKKRKQENAKLEESSSIDASSLSKKQEIKKNTLIISDTRHGAEGEVYSPKGSIIFKYEEIPSKVMPVLLSLRKA